MTLSCCAAIIRLIEAIFGLFDSSGAISTENVDHKTLDGKSRTLDFHSSSPHENDYMFFCYSFVKIVLSY